MKKGFYVFLGIMLPIAAIVTGTVLYVKKRPVYKEEKPEVMTATIEYEHHYEIKEYKDLDTNIVYPDVLHLSVSLTNRNKSIINYLALGSVVVNKGSLKVAENNYRDAVTKERACTPKLNLKTNEKYTWELLFPSGAYNQDSFTEEIDNLTITADYMLNPVPASGGLTLEFKSANINASNNLSMSIEFTNDTGVFINTMTLPHLKLIYKDSGESTDVVDAAFPDPWSANLSQGTSSSVTIEIGPDAFDASFWSGEYDVSKIEVFYKLGFTY